MDKNFKKQNYKEIMKLLAVLSHLGYLMLTPVLVCVIGGSWLDSYFKTSPWILIAGVILGVAASFRNLFYYMNKYGK